MPEQLPPRLLAALDQYEVDARSVLAQHAVRFQRDADWGLIDQIGEFSDEDRDWLAILLAVAVRQLASLSTVMGIGGTNA